jgi:hypothetical protein
LVRVTSLHFPLFFFFLFGDSFLLLSVTELKVFLIHVALPLGGCVHFDALREYHVGQCGTQLLVEVLGDQDELVVPVQLLKGEGWLVEEEAPGEVPGKEKEKEGQGQGTEKDRQGISVGLQESFEQPEVPL